MKDVKQILKRFREKFLGTFRKDSPPANIKKAESQVTNLPSSKPDRDPYILHIGMDFGTAFTKCIYRDLDFGKAQIYLPERQIGDNPFLISSALIYREDGFIHPKELSQYPNEGLPHLKMALESLALAKFESPFLRPYWAAIESSDERTLARFVKHAAVYLLGGVLGDVRKTMQREFTGWGAHPHDHLAVNMAVPVANTQKPEVEACFSKVLRLAWVLADKLAGFPEMHFVELDRWIAEAEEESETQKLRDACYIYPETSANMQGFVRSRTAQSGPCHTYLFSDTGAGTVDQSIFIFTRFVDDEERLNYLASNVLPLGSSWIERRAAEAMGKIDKKTLDELRAIKESGVSQSALDAARKKLAMDLTNETITTIACAREMLFEKSQIEEIKILFGGGGHCENPYHIAVINAFKSNLFSRNIQPPVIGLPIPNDLKWPLGLDYRRQARWMRRLSVAYGLSFSKDELADRIYPDQMEKPL